ncbi:MAG: EcsC family protein [Desulfatibacillaceae bacterium]
MHPDDRRSLEQAVRLLEYPTYAARLSEYIGMPVEKAVALLPGAWHRSLSDITEDAIRKSLEFSIRTLGAGKKSLSGDLRHRAMAVATGGVSGLFGVPALAVELPVTTTIILRSIADIGRSEGESLRTPESRLACMEVFALGTGSEDAAAVDAGYFAVRAALARSLSDAASFVAATSLFDGTAPVIVRIAARIASRYGLFVSQRFAAQAIPLIGALAGGGVNLLFITHFQNMARGHFIVRRLERSYGAETVLGLYLDALERLETRSDVRPRKRGPDAGGTAGRKSR